MHIGIRTRHKNETCPHGQRPPSKIFDRRQIPLSKKHQRTHHYAKASGEHWRRGEVANEKNPLLSKPGERGICMSILIHDPLLIKTSLVIRSLEGSEGRP